MPAFTATVQAGNLFTDAETPPEGERFETPLAHDKLVVERMVSSAAALTAGDYSLLPANTPQRQLRQRRRTLAAVHLHPSPVVDGEYAA